MVSSKSSRSHSMLRRLFLSSLVVQSISSLVAMEGSCKSSVHLWKSPWAVFTAFCTSLCQWRSEEKTRTIISCPAAVTLGQPHVQLSRDATASSQTSFPPTTLCLFCKNKDLPHILLQHKVTHGGTYFFRESC